MTTAIRFDHVSKRFTLRHQRPRSFQELVIQLFKPNGDSSGSRPGAGLGAHESGSEDFWALHDVSFTVEHGETFGIIGPNGAGKSTVLKLVSRIIEPTAGRIDVNGRIGALLELGAGFHPDLSGRENIYLNGSILGLSRDEIEKELDTIVRFAELERFIDMPIKHYSSGMRMRLGFSIAAHIDPEILLIDEVLAVGDESFQHKCLDRIMEMRQRGVTICFVSHGLDSVKRLCSRAIWLNRGTVEVEGRVDDVISAYLRHAADEEESRLRTSVRAVDEQEEDLGPEAGRPGGLKALRQLEITDVSLGSASGNWEHIFRVGQPWVVAVRYRSPQEIENPGIKFWVRRNDGLCVCESSVHSADLGIPYVVGDGTVFYDVESLPLMEGTYSLSVSFHDQTGEGTFDRQDHVQRFKTRQVGLGERYGLASLQGQWEWSGEVHARLGRESDPVANDGEAHHPELGSERRWGTGDVRIVDVSFVDGEGTERRVFEKGESWTARLRYQADCRTPEPVFGLAIHRDDGVHVCGPNTRFAGMHIPCVETEGEVLYTVKSLPLLEGSYLLSVAALNRADTRMYDYHDRVYAFRVCQFDSGERAGVLTLPGVWRWDQDSAG